MQALQTWSPPPLMGVLTDIDDTLTQDGNIDRMAVQALGDLRQAGWCVVAITGRPVGWCEPLAHDWPVDAIVAENGAVAWHRAADGSLQKNYQQGAAQRAQNLAHMQDVLALIEQSVPGAVRARDSAGRETDIAIDHSEFAQLSPEAIAQVVRVMQAQGLHATVSSIHINGWMGEHNKWQGACWILRQLFAIDLAANAQQWVYVGDSTNDELMFAHLPHSVGVANIRRFAPALRHPPRYITEASHGQGFVELAQHLLKHRGPTHPPGR